MQSLTWETRNIKDTKGLIETFLLEMFKDFYIFIYLIQFISQFISYHDDLEFSDFLLIYAQPSFVLVTETHMKITVKILFLFQHKYLLSQI